MKKLFIDNYEIACISAVSENLDEKENKERNRVLSAYLLYRGYGITNIESKYIKSFGKVDIEENSFFVVNLRNSPDFYQILFMISVYYHQDSFLYKPKGHDAEAYVIGTSHRGVPGYEVWLSVGKLDINIEKDLLDTFMHHTLYGKQAIAIIAKPLVCCKCSHFL